MSTVRGGLLAASALLSIGPSPLEARENTCTYHTWEWNTLRKASENHRLVTKKYSELSEEERDERSGCTVCQEDQVSVHVRGAPRFRICRYVARRVEAAVRDIVRNQWPLEDIVGYRVGRSRGVTDLKGYRTIFSNHSYGTALDINPARNGLYVNCITFTPSCRLIRGGPWDPTQKGSITENSVVYRAFSAVGWKWGGKLKGRQKDFMHFSPTGD